MDSVEAKFSENEVVWVKEKASGSDKWRKGIQGVDEPMCFFVAASGGVKEVTYPPPYYKL